MKTIKFGDNWSDWVAELRAENAKLKAELERQKLKHSEYHKFSERCAEKAEAELERAQERASSFEGSFNASIVRISELEDHIRARQLAFEAELEQVRKERDELMMDCRNEHEN